MAGEIGALVLAGLLLFLAFAALALMASLRRPRDPLLAAFAAFVGLFGTRLALRSPVFRDLLRADDFAGEFASDLITYLIPLPILLASTTLLAGRWRAVARGLVVYQVLFALTAIGIDLARGRPGSGMRLNNFAVAAFLLLSIVFALVRRRDWARAIRTREGLALAVGLSFFVPVALGENIRELGLRPGLRMPESLALLILVSCVGYALTVRAGRREGQLAALERELDVARGIQSSLLPRPSLAVTGLDVAARFVPLSSVAGDFYDFIPDGENGLAIIVADVTGHGVPAALVASMMKVACHSVPQDLAHPSLGLARVNQLLCRMGVGQLVTAAWIHLDASARRFVYGAAGHPPLLVWRAASRTVETVAEGGVLLGLMPEANYTQVAGVLQPGDRVLVYTDGVTEANGPSGEFFGQDRLASALAEGTGLDASAGSDQLLKRLREWHGASPFDDDLTFVLVDVLNGDAERRRTSGWS